MAGWGGGIRTLHLRIGNSPRVSARDADSHVMFLSGLRAEAQRRWQEPSSRPLSLDGPGAELLHKGEEIGHAPVLGDLAVAHAHDINGLELNLTARRCHAQEFSPVRPVVGLVRRHAVAICKLPMDFRVKVGKCGPEDFGWPGIFPLTSVRLRLS